MAFEDFVDEFTDDEIRELATAIRNNEVSADRENELDELLSATTMAQRQAAFEEKSAVVDLFAMLGVDFDFPGEEPGEPPDDLEEVDIAPEPERPGPEGQPRERRPERRRPEGPAEVGRPNPFGGNADREIARQFFGGDQRKGQAWVSAEQDRIARGGEDPAAYWESFGARVWGNELSAEEFVDPGTA